MDLEFHERTFSHTNQYFVVMHVIQIMGYHELAQGIFDELFSYEWILYYIFWICVSGNSARTYYCIRVT